MARIQLKDVTVTRLNQTGHGVKVSEKTEYAGKSYETRYTLWFTAEHGLTVGDIVSVSGFLGSKVNSWEKDGVEHHTVELSVNQPKLDGFPAPAVQVEEPWAASAETPF